MSRLLTRALRLTLALAVAGGLGFGASTAFAGISVDPIPCFEYPPEKSCTSHLECDFACKQYFGSETTGECVMNCCRCVVF
jgi:hypothetical protein